MERRGARYPYRCASASASRSASDASSMRRSCSDQLRTRPREDPGVAERRAREVRQRRDVEFGRGVEVAQRPHLVVATRRLACPRARAGRRRQRQPLVPVGPQSRPPSVTLIERLPVAHGRGEIVVPASSLRATSVCAYCRRSTSIGGRGRLARRPWCTSTRSRSSLCSTSRTADPVATIAVIAASRSACRTAVIVHARAPSLGHTRTAASASVGSSARVVVSRGVIVRASVSHSPRARRRRPHTPTAPPRPSVPRRGVPCGRPQGTPRRRNALRRPPRPSVAGPSRAVPAPTPTSPYPPSNTTDRRERPHDRPHPHRHRHRPPARPPRRPRRRAHAQPARGPQRPVGPHDGRLRRPAPAARRR